MCIVTYSETIKIYLNTGVDNYIKTLASGFLNILQKNGTISKYFFIRYYDSNGYHLRLRMLTCVDITNLFNDLVKFDNSHNNNVKYDITDYIIEKYLPEVERYGGEEGIKIAESFFFYNSKFVVDCLRNSRFNSYNERLLEAIIANTIIVKSFINDGETINFLDTSKNLWMGFLLTNENQEPSDIVGLFDKRFQFVKSNMLKVYDYCMSNKKSGLHNVFENQCIAHRMRFEKCCTLTTNLDYFSKPLYGIVDSLIHMNNNRFGINNRDESYILSLILNMFKCKWG